MAKVKVAYKQGTKATYLGLSEHPDNYLFWCTNTRELYKGNALYTDGVRWVDSFKMLPDFVSAADGKLYMCRDTQCGYTLNEERNNWVLAIHGPDNDTIEFDEGGALRVKQVPVDSVTGLEEKVQGQINDNELSDSDILDALAEADLLAAVADGDGAVFTDENGNVLLW